jgi:uncharacterized protein YbjQ (UPF0145 family)
VPAGEPFTLGGSADYDRFVARADGGGMIDGRMDVPARAGPASACPGPLRQGQARGSLLSAGEFAALTGAGFDPVGYVLGTAVIRLGSPNRSGLCDGPGRRRTHIAPAGELFQLALSRAAGECEAFGGDGIVGVTVQARPFPAGGTEFTVQGTAVRARTAVRPAAPFTAHVSPQEFAGLLRAGWVPAALAVGVSVGTRHDDRRRLPGLGNREMPGYTELVSDTRGVARTRLMHAAMRHAAEGVVVGEMTLRISERHCQTYEGSHDRVAEVTMLGTSIVSFGRSPATADRPPLTMMRLNPAAEIAGQGKPAMTRPGGTA